MRNGQSTAGTSLALVSVRTVSRKYISASCSIVSDKECKLPSGQQQRPHNLLYSRSRRRETEVAHINVNLNNVKSDVHPEGMTRLRIVSGEHKSKKDDPSGPGYIEWKVEVVDSHLKRPIYFNTTLKEESLRGIVSLYKACRRQWNSDGSIDTEDMLGAEFMGNVGVEEYNGDKKNTVNFPYQPCN